MVKIRYASQNLYIQKTNTHKKDLYKKKETNHKPLFNYLFHGYYKVYQEARKLVGAQMQVITFKHWLPIIIGKQGMELLGDYEGYVENAYKILLIYVSRKHARSFFKNNIQKYIELNC